MKIIINLLFSKVPCKLFKMVAFSLLGTVAFGQNNCLDFNGAGGRRVEISNASTLLNGTDWTLEFMINISSFGTDNFKSIIGHDPFTDPTEVDRSPSLWVSHNFTYLGETYNKALHYDTHESGAGTGRYFGLVNNVFSDTDTWYHIAWVKDGTESRIYIDGFLVETYTLSANVHVNSTYSLGAIETASMGSYYKSDQFMDELRIWSDVRTEEEIRNNMGREMVGTEAGLEAYYNFNATSGTTLVDQTGNGYTGSLISPLDATDWVASGASTTWDNTGTADWASASNWTNGVPGATASNVGIPAGGTQPEISTAVSIKNLSIETGASLTLKNGGDLTASGTTVVSNTSTMTLESGSDLTVAAGSDMIVSTGGTVTSAGDITVANTGQMIIEPNAIVSTSGALTVTGADAIRIKSTAAGTGNLVYTGSSITYPSSGSVTVERYLAGNTDLNSASYHYISSPVTAQAVFGDEADLYGYKESNTTWIDPSDPTDGFSTFDPGAGYAMRYTSNTTKEFVGEMNDGSVTEPITNTANPGNPYEYYNIFGNPYPSSISATDFITANSANLNNTVSFWAGQDFAVYNTSLGAGTAGSMGATPDDNISVGQAFFVESTAAGTATFTNSMRTSDSDNFYRKSSQDLIRLNVNSSTDFNQLIVAQHDESTTEIEELDSKKLRGNKDLSFYSICNETQLAIQSLPELNSETVVQLGFETSKSDWFTFSKDELTDFKGTVYFWDSYKDHIVDLNKETYKVFLEEGIYSNRFKMVFALREGMPVNDVEFNAYVNGTTIQLDLSQDLAIERVSLYGINGQLVKSWTNQIGYDVSGLQNGVYLLQIEIKEGITKSTRVVLVN